MSGGFDSSGSQSTAAAGGTPGTVDTAKQEASEVKDVATEAATDVLHTAKNEAASVAGAAKSQIKDLYAQSRSELGGQASQQQERLASGLHAAGSELGAMAQRSEGSGIATDLVQQVSTRLSSAADWLSSREPADVLDEVKRFARRRPLVFIAGAAVAGIVAGRLVRALSAAQQDTSSPAVSGAEPTPLTAPALTPAAPTFTGTEPVTDSPVFDSTTRAADTQREVRDERPDSV